MKLQIRTIEGIYGPVMALCREDGTAFGLQERTEITFEADGLNRFTVTFLIEKEDGDITLALSEKIA